MIINPLNRRTVKIGDKFFEGRFAVCSLSLVGIVSSVRKDGFSVQTKEGRKSGAMHYSWKRLRDITPLRVSYHRGVNANKDSYAVNDPETRLELRDSGTSRVELYTRVRDATFPSIHR